MQLIGWAGNSGDPGKVKRMFKPKSNCKIRRGTFFFWKSDDFIVALNCSNSQGAKGVTKFGPLTLNSLVETLAAEPRLRGHQ